MKQFRGNIYNWVFNKTMFAPHEVVCGVICPLENEERTGQGFWPGRQTTIRTSAVVKKTMREDGVIVVETMNSIYHLHPVK